MASPLIIGMSGCRRRASQNSGRLECNCQLIKRVCQTGVRIRTVRRIIIFNSTGGIYAILADVLCNVAGVGIIFCLMRDVILVNWSYETTVKGAY